MPAKPGRLLAALLILLSGILSITYVACTKASSASSTIVKCVTCLNGGSCINDTCRCPSGYEGVTCQTLTIQKFINEWDVTETGSLSGTSNLYFVDIQQSFTGTADEVTISNLYHETISSVNATISGDSIYIPSQVVTSSATFEPVEITGRGFIHSGGVLGKNGVITMSYEVINLTASPNTTDDFGFVPGDGSSPSQWTAN